MRRRIAIGAGAMASALVVAAAAHAVSMQSGNLRVSVQSQIQPFKLPRDNPAPIAVFVSGHVGTANGEVPPQLRRMTVKVNRHGTLQAKGLPTCTIDQIQPGSSNHALGNCGDALVGSGRFWAQVVFPDQRPYPTRGRLLVFNGRKGGKPVLFAHIYTTEPFNTSFVVTFSIESIHDGPYGTELTAAFPRALGDWGFVDRIKLTLRRKYQVDGEQRSYFNASCPAPDGTRFVSYPLALASFSFEEGESISVTVEKSCGVKE